MAQSGQNSNVLVLSDTYLNTRTVPILIILATAIGTGSAHAQPYDEWTHYGGSQHGLQFSSLSQITPQNVERLQEVWRFRTGELGQGHREPFAFEANPILVEGRLYFPTGSAIVFALDPETGKEIWRFDAKIDRTLNHAEIANRGVTSWIDETVEEGANCRHRIFVGTLDARLIALDGENGRPCADFGANGQIHLDRDVGTDIDEWVIYTVTSPPAIVGDTLVVGSAIGDNQAVQSELGIVRGIDARSGTERWRWDPIPRDDSNPAYAGWNPDEAAINGSANAWAPFAADTELGLVYVPTGSASPDFYGGEREGDNLHANSLVALDAETGEVAWYQQLIHHDVWDYDLASQPTLVDLQHDGKIIPAVLQGTKTGFIFSFDRRTGEPVFQVEERPVPQGAVAGEHLSPTQPFPVAPPALVRTDAVEEQDAWGMLYFDKRACKKKIAGMRSEGVFTPPSIEGTILLPGYAGGINWGGLAFDPDKQLAVTFAMNVPMAVALIPRSDLRNVYESGEFAGQEIARQAGTPFAMRRTALLSPIDMPCIAPPWGTLSAVDMVSGRINWQIPLGTIQDVAPAIVPNFKFGVPGIGGPIITASGLIFIAAAIDNYLRAFDIDSGEKLWEGRLPAGGQATPMTYALEKTGKQYIVIAAGGHGRIGSTTGDFLIAYALP